MTMRRAVRLVEEMPEQDEEGVEERDYYENDNETELLQRPGRFDPTGNYGDY